MDDLIIIIMAGGLGKRMNSNIPKVLHKINEKPMLVRVLETSFKLNPKKIMVVVGKYREIISNTLEKYISLDEVEFIDQSEPKGTGDAIKCCRPHLLSNHKVLILSGDVPLVSETTMLETIKNLNKCKIVVTSVDNPNGLGRIIRKDNVFDKIIEDKDCSDEFKRINLINTGIYSFHSDILHKYLPLIKNNNNQQEYYLTDIIEIIKEGEKIDIQMFEISKDKQYELIGVNSQQQLLALNELYKSNIMDK